MHASELSFSDICLFMHGQILFLFFEKLNFFNFLKKKSVKVLLLWFSDSCRSVFSHCYCCVGALETTQKLLLSFRAEVFWLRCEVACTERVGDRGSEKESDGGGIEGGSLFLVAPFLILLFQTRGRVYSAGRCAWQCWTWVADGRQGTGTTGRLWFFELILVHVCEGVVFHWPIFWVVEFTCVAMRAGLGPPSRCDVDLVCLIPTLPPPPSHKHTCAHTHPRRQILNVQSDIQYSIHFSHACLHRSIHICT